MSTKIIIGVLVLGVLIVGMVYFSRLAVAPTNGEKVPMREQNGDATMKETVVEMVSGGFSPADVIVTKGTVVRFINKDSKPHQPASASHPTHFCYPGFDSLKPVAPGDSFSFTAGVAKICGFHDHLNTGLRGTLTVTE